VSSSAVVRALAWLATLLAGVSSAAGVFAGDLYGDAPYWVQQARGTDVATLFLAVPLLAIGLWSAARESDAGRAIVVGVLMYLVYNYAIFAFSVAMNPLSAVYMATLGLAVWSLGLMLVAGRSADLMGEVVDRLPRRLTAVALIGIAILFGMLWLGQIAQATISGELPPDLVRTGLPTNPIYALDLGLFLPMCVVAGVGLLRRHAATSAFAVPMLLWLALTSAGIVAAFWYTASAGEVVPIPVVVLVSAIGVVTALLAGAGLIRRNTAVR
jgi:hypothetical protein